MTLKLISFIKIIIIDLSHRKFEAPPLGRLGLFLEKGQRSTKER